MLVKEKLNTVLLIDNHSESSSYHRGLITGAGIAEHVDTAANAVEGLQYLLSRDRYPDLILIDVYLPEMSGWEFMAEFHRLPLLNRRNSTVIALSPSPTPGEKQIALLMDSVADFKSTPLDLKELQDIISEHFGEML